MEVDWLRWKGSFHFCLRIPDPGGSVTRERLSTSLFTKPSATLDCDMQPQPGDLNSAVFLEAFRGVWDSVKNKNKGKLVNIWELSNTESQSCFLTCV